MELVKRMGDNSLIVCGGDHDKIGAINKKVVKNEEFTVRCFIFSIV